MRLSLRLYLDGFVDSGLIKPKTLSPEELTDVAAITRLKPQDNCFSSVLCSRLLFALPCLSLLLFNLFQMVRCTNLTKKMTDWTLRSTWVLMGQGHHGYCWWDFNHQQKKELGITSCSILTKSLKSCCGYFPLLSSPGHLCSQGQPLVTVLWWHHFRLLQSYPAIMWLYVFLWHKC